MAGRDRSTARSKGKKATGSDLRARVLVAIPAAVAALFLIVQGGEIFAFGALALGLIGLHEYYRMTDSVEPVKLVGFLALIALVFTALYGDRGQVLMVLLAALPVTFIFVVLKAPRSSPIVTVAITLLGIYWIGIAIAHAVMLRELPHGDGVLIDILIATFLGDTGAYLGGKAFGQRKLATKISPNKTVEGLLIGMATAVAACWFAGLYQDWLSSTDALLIGVAAAVFAPLGDLFESLIKRDAGVKDSGTLFGAHGGALDRLDAAFFSIVAGYYVWLAML